jgi:hypothetical protein
LIVINYPKPTTGANALTTSVVAFAIDLYSVLVLEHGRMGYFLALHDIKLGQKNIAKPLVDLLSSTLLAQSASENTLTKIELDRFIS